jgi:hypothetical protein
MRIERSIGKFAISAGATQRTSVDSELGVGVPPIGRAVKTTENSCRASLLLV